MLFGGAAFLITKRQTAKYSSTATFYVMAKKDLNLSLDKDITLTNAVTPWISSYVTSTSVVDELNKNYLAKINENYSDISTESLKKAVNSSIAEYKDIDAEQNAAAGSIGAGDVSSTLKVCHHPAVAHKTAGKTS